MRYVFAGTSEFARTVLARLLDDGLIPVAVYTRADKRSGRGLGYRPSPVKELVRDRLGADFAVEQPASFAEDGPIERLEGFGPDILLTCAYGMILPQTALDVPGWAPINAHASLLPRWRGAAPIRYALASGDTATGITLARMERELDSGAILDSSELAIGARWTYGELAARLADEAARLSSAYLSRLSAAQPSARQSLLGGQEQDERLVSYAPRLRPGQLFVDWRKGAVEIEAWIRALQPQPRARTILGGELLIIHEAAIDECRNDERGLEPGVVCADPRALRIRCGAGALCPQRVQLPGKKAVDMASFVNGRSLEPWFGLNCQAGPDEGP